jgi:UDP-N-acetylmuramate dehydrogenase
MVSLQDLQSQLPSITWQSNYPLAEKTYFKLGGPAEIFGLVSTIDELAQLRHICTATQTPLTVLGGASNIIVADEGIAGVVVQLNHTAVTLVDKQETYGILRAGAGVKSALLVKQAIDAGLAGLEYFLGVPGTLGGAVYNNAHYLQHLIGEFITQVQVVTSEGEIVWLPAAECDFAYDHSRFQTSDEVIFEVEFQLPLGDKATSQALIVESTRYRAATQPLGEPSSGCIFQNVPNTPELKAMFPQFAESAFVSGGFLIDQAGLKGTQVGGVEVSHKHAAFIINNGTGTARDVQSLIQVVKERVKEKFGVELQEEVFYVS